MFELFKGVRNWGRIFNVCYNIFDEIKEIFWFFLDFLFKACYGSHKHKYNTHQNIVNRKTYIKLHKTHRILTNLFTI